MYPKAKWGSIALLAVIVVASLLSYAYFLPNPNTGAAKRISEAPGAQPVPQQPPAPQAPPPPAQRVEEVKGDFTLEIERFKAVIQRASTESLAVRIRATPDFNSKISFFAEGVPDGIVLNFDPKEVSASSTGVMKIQVGNNVKIDTFRISIVAKSGNIVKTESLVLDILDNLIVVESYRFPASYTIKVGTKVTWLNKDRGAQEDPGAHTITEVNARFDSGLIYNGDTWGFTFREPGKYEYFCKPHPYMKGEIVVAP